MSIGIVSTYKAITLTNQESVFWPYVNGVKNYLLTDSELIFVVFCVLVQGCGGRLITDESVHLALISLMIGANSWIDTRCLFRSVRWALMDLQSSWYCCETRVLLVRKLLFGEDVRLLDQLLSWKLFLGSGSSSESRTSQITLKTTMQVKADLQTQPLRPDHFTSLLVTFGGDKMCCW